MGDMDGEGPMGCTVGDREELVTMVNAIFRPDGRQDILTDYPLVYRDDNLANIRLVRVHGRIVAVVPFIRWQVVHAGCRFSVGIISPTGTHPEHRLRGHALRCLRNCVERMSAQDVDLSVLWTDTETFRFYNHAGYEAVGDQGHRFTWRRADAHRFVDHGETVVRHDPAEPRFLADLCALHDAEPGGLVRTPDRAAALFALPLLTTLLARRRGEAVAYLAISASTNKPGVVEAAGDRDALETLCHHAIAGRGDEQDVPVYIPLCQTAFADLMHDRLGDRRRPGNENQVFRINNATAFLRRLAPWLERQNGGRAASLSIGVDDPDETVSLDFQEGGLAIGAERRSEHIELTRCQLASAVFGPHRERPFDAPPPLARLFPFDFPITILDRS